MRTVTDDEIKEALADPDNRRLLLSLAGRYGRFLEVDEVHRCKLLAVWRALRSHNPAGGRRFLHSLYHFATWEFLTALRRRRRQWARREVSLESFSKPAREALFAYDPTAERAAAEENIAQLLEHKMKGLYRHVLYEYYVCGRSTAEIGKSLKRSDSAVQQMLRRARKKLPRCICLADTV
jgi:RNA polymerase sigma factor (sigma-70 family)